MSARRGFEATLARLAEIRADPNGPAATADLRRALAHRSNLIVARAAEIVGEWELGEFAADMGRAFDWFLVDAVRRDPTCAAKIALAEAMVKLEVDDSDLFARGLGHRQLEPVWGGAAATAAHLRATRALGLARANPARASRPLATLLADSEPDARTGAARAIAVTGHPGATPLLWYKTLIGDAEIAPLYESFAGLLALEPDKAAPHVGAFLHSPSPALAEAAALALGQSRLAAAGPVLREAWVATGDPALRRSLLQALAALDHDEVFAFLLELLANGPADDARDVWGVLLVYRGDARRWRKIERLARARPDLSAEDR